MADPKATSTEASDNETKTLDAIQKILRVVAKLPPNLRSHVMIAAGEACGVKLAVRGQA